MLAIRAHCKEECEYGELCCHGCCCIVGCSEASPAQAVQNRKELGRYGFLPMCGGVKIFEGAEELLDSGSKDFEVLEVKGALLETLPKRRSHVACGRSDSACNHWAFTMPLKFTAFRPRSCSVTGDEGFCHEVDLLL